jgi:hypothetical protein
MGILDKLLRRNRDDDHAKWLEANPGKGKMPTAEPIVSDDEQAATRARMEAEVAAQNAKRNAQ